MEAVTLNALIPKPSEFTLSATKKTYKLNPFSADDTVWVTDKFGEDGIKKIFGGKFRDLCAIVYHLLSDEDRADFPYEEDENAVDDDGKKFKRVLTGPVKLCDTIRGGAEITAVQKALLECIGMSQPLLDKLEVKQEKAEKKSRRVGQK